MALSALFSLRWARSIFRPVEQMNRTMQRVEDGDTGARVGPVAARDEIGALASHLDQLLDVIDDKTRALQQLGRANSTQRWPSARASWRKATPRCSRRSSNWSSRKSSPPSAS